MEISYLVNTNQRDQLLLSKQLSTFPPSLCSLKAFFWVQQKLLLLFLFTCSFIYNVVLISLFIYLYCCSYLFVQLFILLLLSIMLFYLLVHLYILLIPPIYLLHSILCNLLLCACVYCAILLCSPLFLSTLKNIFYPVFLNGL